jgi:hypothetical protein
VGLESNSRGLLHISSRLSQVLEPLDDILAGVPGALAGWWRDGRGAARERLALHCHIDLDVLVSNAEIVEIAECVPGNFSAPSARSVFQIVTAFSCWDAPVRDRRAE